MGGDAEGGLVSLPPAFRRILLMIPDRRPTLGVPDVRLDVSLEDFNGELGLALNLLSAPLPGGETGVGELRVGLRVDGEAPVVSGEC